MKNFVYCSLIILSISATSNLAYSMDVDKEIEKPVKNKIKKNEKPIDFSEEEIRELIRNAKPLNNFSKQIVEIDQKRDIFVSSKPLK